MSLPPATKDVSTHPTKGSVTDPVDKEQMRSDVDRKLRFYGVIEAFRAGRLPDNAQIDDTLRYVTEHSPVDLSKLSPAGKQLVSDTKDIIETARLMVKEKNADELFQNFVWHTRAVDYSPAKRDPTASVPVSAEQAKADGHQAAHHLRTLLSLLLTNGEARKLLSDFSVVGRDLLARTADLVRPDDEELRRVDEPAEEGFAPRDGNVLPRREEEAVRQGLDGAREGRGAVQENIAGARHDASGATSGTAPRDTEEANAAAKETKQSLKDRITGLKDRVPQQHRDRAAEQFDRAKNFLNEEYFPKARRDQFVFRGKKVILECQKHKDYQESITWLLDILTAYGEHSASVAADGKDGAKGVWADKTLKAAISELIALLSRFANNTSPQPALDAARTLFADARADPELRAWFGRANAWARKVLLEAGYVLEPRCGSEGVEIREDGRRFFDDKYKGHFDALFDAIGSWFSSLAADPLNKRFGRDWARLTRDLLFDGEGRQLAWKGELWADIRRVIVPQIVDKVGYIPIPRAEFTDDNLDLVIENLTLSGRNLFPNIVSIEAHNFVKFSPYSSIQDEAHHDFTLTLGQMQADMRDVMFYFNKKTGVPKLKDSGVADIVLGGEGITATVHLTGAGKDTSSVFHVKDVHVKVDSLKFSIRDSKHDALYKVLRPLATGIVKKQVQRALRDALRTALELVDEQLVKVRDRMEEAKASEDTTRTQALKDLFKRQTDDASAKAKEKQEKRHSQFKVVAKRDSLLLPEQGNPQGWVNRQQEKQEIAQDGHEWRSKAFTIIPQVQA